MLGVHTLTQRSTTQLQRLAAASMRTWLALRYRVVGRRYNRLVLEEIDGVPLLVLPHVFNPVLLRTGAFMARAVTTVTLPAVPLGQRVRLLDMGTGSGVGAVFAARRGMQVVAVDINPEAVRCARINVLLNQLDERVEVRQGDLSEPVSQETFDVVLFNPPFYRGQPRGLIDHAWRGRDVFERFVAGLDARLAPGGCALLVLSTDGDCDDLLVALWEAGWHVEAAVAKNLINEVVTMYAVTRQAP